MSRFLRGLRGGTTASSTESTPTSSSSASSSRLPSPRPSKGTSTPTPATNATSHLLFLPHDAVQRPAQEVLSVEEEAKVKRLRNHVEKLIQMHYYHLPADPASTSESGGKKRRKDGSKDAQGHLVELFYEKWEYRWLDLEQGEGNTVRRYLRAAKGNEEEAIKRVESSLTWRRAFKPDIIPPEDVRIEGETGKSLPLGFDVEGRVVLYLNPGKENTKPSERQIRHVVWGLERAIDLLPPYQSKLTLVIDFKQASQAQNPNMSTSLKVLNILQNHYVERLGLALALNPPWYLNAFWSSVQPFLDPITKTKVKWNPQGEELRGLIPPEHLPRYYGGDYDFVFDKDVFWNDELEWCGIAADGTRVHESWSRSGGRVEKKEGDSSVEWGQEQELEKEQDGGNTSQKRESDRQGGLVDDDEDHKDDEDEDDHDGSRVVVMSDGGESKIRDGTDGTTSKLSSAARPRSTISSGADSFVSATTGTDTGADADADACTGPLPNGHGHGLGQG